ncbi:MULTISPECIES: NrfD/PsrC family molybdoenzyme membrane anchor subunit [Actinomadura]|uniref:NrfD/PsrC family molybdoenzyme membrane anchor subunit n=1 Tax=Actinomadura yumaensis TaxID=111807 RepID=A0ABW2CX82_9ACTN|nr:NrfD/PsrC family molybdoenzyme membrane anchor subunit [Actinomadura sp. J1-007]MWK38859.1 polysulfide reductase [Actinomadura sp. J1-007]
MSEAEVTREGSLGQRPGREASPGSEGGRRRRRGGRRGERAMVPDAEFRSYYGRPIIKAPTWAATDIAGYLFLGGLAGASSVLAFGAEVTGRPALARAAKAGALGAISLSTAALIHDLGRPERFVNMLRVAKPTSPMSMGSWILVAYGPAAGLAAVTDATGLFRRIGRAATGWTALTGPAVVSYTSVLIADTAVPAWHEAYRELPFVFAGSGAAAAAGLGLVAAPVRETAPARGAAVFGAVLDVAATRLLERRLGPIAEPYRTGRGGRLMRAAQALTVAGAAGAAVFAGRSRAAAALCGGALLAGSACTRFGIFEAGRASAEDPRYTVMVQRGRREPSG